jgi:rifampicin phosphotransferase
MLISRPMFRTLMRRPALSWFAMLSTCMLIASVCVAASTRPAFTHSIPDEATWQSLAARPAVSSIARTEVVKFLLDREDGRMLWFVDTEKFPVHYEFAREHIPRTGRVTRDHETFNRVQYSDPARRFELGSLVHYLDTDLWTFELVSGDSLEGPRILELYLSLKAALWVGDRLKYRPLAEGQQRAAVALGTAIPRVNAETVFGRVTYQPLTLGKTYGYLRLVTGPLDPASVRADQILVLETLPEEIPVSAGVVSAELQAPLGHIAILCATRGTPNMALRAAVHDDAFRALDGKLVALEVGPQEYRLAAATLAEAQRAWRARRPKRPQVPALALGETRLRDVDSLKLADARFAGAKAAQLGEVARMGGVRTPGGFVIPLSYYRAHVERSGAARDLADRLADSRFNQDSARRGRWLAAVRETIEATPVDHELLANVRARMQALAPDSRWILRSSTNAEDLAGFTGAGLYRSVRVKAGANETELANAIRSVWASVWLQGAFEERAWYRVDHAAVGMAILVQPFVDGAVANGVAITANPYSEARPGIFINAQTLAGSVTGAGGNEVPEQYLVYTFKKTFEPELLSRSSRLGGEALLGEREVLDLAAVLSRLHTHFMRQWSGDSNAVDVEFLLTGTDRQVVILQARPYQVRYAEGQRLRDFPVGKAR